jgi:hypothetical protein
MTEEINLDLSKLKNIKLKYVLLGAFLILGIYLRAYHLDFPSIGYHNMKENEYLGEAIFFNEQGDLLHRRTFNFWGLEDGPGYFEEYAQPPLVPYMILPFWKMFGEQLWIARSIIMIFALGTILLTYTIVKKLTENEYLSLLSAFLMTIMPLGVYFGRNVQPEMPALFFTLLSINFLLNWKKEFNKKQLMYSAIALSIAGLFKLTFLIIAIPILFIFPYGKIKEMFEKDKKQFYVQIKYAIIGFLVLVLVQGLFEVTIVDPSKKAVNEISIKTVVKIFDASYWSSVWPALSSYIKDNYTWWYFWFAIAGFAFILMKRKTAFSKLMTGYAIAIPLYIGLLSGKIGGHSYYHMPFLPFFVIASAYFLLSIGTILKQTVKVKYIQFVPLLLILLTMSSVGAANDRVWTTIFYGQDVVGEYIKEHTNPDERFINMGHSQTYAVCTYARRRCGEFYNATHLIEVEKKFDIRFINFDAYWFNMLQQEQNKEALEYIQKNYRIKLVGALPGPNNQLSITNVLLEKGGVMDLSEVQTKQPQLAKTYYTKSGEVPFYIIEN